MANKSSKATSSINDLFDVYHLRITFEDEILATCGTNEYFLKQRKDEEERTAIKNAEEVYEDVDEDERPITVFPRTDNMEPFIYDYLIKGFLKNAAKMFNTLGGENKLTSYKSKIDGGVFVEPRQLLLQLPEGEEISLRCRPLRASTMQGERVTIARSESAPAGTTIECCIKVMNPDIKKMLFKY